MDEILLNEYAYSMNGMEVNRFRNLTKDSLRTRMRKLWSEHIIWTRMYILSVLNETGDKKINAERLLSNQKDIADVFGFFYGKKAQEVIHNSLKEHILIAVDLIEALKLNNKEKADDASSRWYKNADEMSIVLNKINPFWKQSDMKKHLYRHLQLTSNQVNARLNKKWSSDAEFFEMTYNQALKEMADGMAYGFIKHFPKRFQN